MQMTMPLNQGITDEQIQMINKAIEVMQGNRRAEKERAEQIEHRRNELLARDLEARKAQEAIRPCFADRACEAIICAYSVAYAIVYLIAEKLNPCGGEK